MSDLRVHARVAIAASLVAASSTLAGPGQIAAADPAVQAAEQLSQEHGGPASGYELVHQRTAVVPFSGESMWVGKFQAPDGELMTVYRDGGGHIGDRMLFDARAREVAAGLRPMLAKADSQLRQRVDSAAATDVVPVAVWFDADAASAVAGVATAHPEIQWLAGRPVVADLEHGRSIRAELFDARRAVIAEAGERLRSEVSALGGTVDYVSSAAPIAFVDLPAEKVDELAALVSVASLGLERTWRPVMSSAGPTVDANWTTGSGDSGAGVRVAVVEYHNVRNTGSLAGRVVASHSSSGTLAYTSGSTFDHPTWVAGAIAGGGSYPGTAPGSRIVSASTGGGAASLARDRAVIATTDWAISPSGGDADIVNVSLVQDTTTGSEEARRYFDSVVDEDLRVVVAAAGNYSALGTWRVGSPGTGWNVLTVGGTDDRNSAGRSDDRMWYVPGSNGSSYLDPPGTVWNTHGDFNKPNLSAPAVSVVTSNGLGASGTSVSSPIVAGLAAQLIARAPTLTAWPESVRAILMAGAVHRTHMPNGSYSVDHEGVGSASALWANRILIAGDGAYGGYRQGATTGTFTQAIQVGGGQRIRVALAWNSRTAGSSNLGKTDTLATDFDVRIRLPNGALYGSYTFDNSYEWLDVTSPTAGTAMIEVVGSPVAAGGERYSLAWAKIGGDFTPPRVTYRGPEAGEPFAARSTRPTVTFSEVVTGLVSSSVVLTPAGGGTQLPASLTWNGAARRLTVTPLGGLSPGVYQLSLSNHIRDTVGNRLTPTSWTFSVIASSGAWETPLNPARRVAFRAGSHVGYRFDVAGRVTASKAATLAAPSGAAADRRAVIVGQPGRWLHIANGMWAGYWIRESARVGIGGTVESQPLPVTTRVSFGAGSHTGYRFDGNGLITARRTASLAAASGANTSSRSLINGAWYLAITNGIWAGYWIPETSRSSLWGMIEHHDLKGATARFSAGTHGGYRFAADGTVTGTRSATLGAASSAPAIAWAIIHGAPRFLIGAGVWSGHWVNESAVIHTP
jgi:serine protease AprX